DISASEGSGAQLIIRYGYASDYSYRFSGPYLENGTRIPGGATLSVHQASQTDQIIINGETWVDVDEEPLMFSWDISGETRIIYEREEANYTLTIPEDTFYIYDFDIVDYTGRVGSRDSYLIASRFINGSETIIQVLQIQDTSTDVPAEHERLLIHIHPGLPINDNLICLRCLVN
ncbi:unnamed protein product, partial [marine sediment metagenome]